MGKKVKIILIDFCYGITAGTINSMKIKIKVSMQNQYSKGTFEVYLFDRAPNPIQSLTIKKRTNILHRGHFNDIVDFVTTLHDHTSFHIPKHRCIES